MRNVIKMKIRTFRGKSVIDGRTVIGSLVTTTDSKYYIIQEKKEEEEAPSEEEALSGLGALFG